MLYLNNHSLWQNMLRIAKPLSFNLCDIRIFFFSFQNVLKVLRKMHKLKLNKC